MSKELSEESKRGLADFSALSERVRKALDNGQQVRRQTASIVDPIGRETDGIEFHLSIAPERWDAPPTCDVIQRESERHVVAIQKRYLDTVKESHSVTLHMRGPLDKRGELKRTVPIIPSIPESGQPGEMVMTNDGQLHVCVGDNHWCEANDMKAIFFADWHKWSDQPPTKE